jgi:hypothetical protein
MFCVAHCCSALNSVLPHKLNNRAKLENRELYLLCFKKSPYLICYINVQRFVKCCNSNRYNDAVFLQFEILVAAYLYDSEEHRLKYINIQQINIEQVFSDAVIF